MFETLGKLCRYLAYKISVEDSITKFLYLRDQIYFSLLFHTGDRASDLGALSSDRVFGLPDGKGVFISHVASKVASLDNPNNVVLFKSKDEDICPVRLLEEYFVFTETLNINSKSGCLFRCRDVKTQEMGRKPLSASAITDGLKTHLSVIKLYEGESSHSSRRGCAITLRMLGLSDSIINDHVGWNSGGMTDHYARVGELYGPRGVARRLSDAAENSWGISKLCKISRSVLSGICADFILVRWDDTWITMLVGQIYYMTRVFVELYNVFLFV